MGRVLDLDRYLARIGLHEAPSVTAVHRAHVGAIPFENTQSYLGDPVSLAPADIERKLVDEHRGGYCFEQNLLLKAALESIGASVETFLARVRYDAEPGVLRPRSHLVLRVDAENASWLADVGFGRGGLFEPLPFQPGAAAEQSGWRLRLIEDRSELVLQVFEDGRWVDLYGFVPEPAPAIDIETSNWWACTNPRSPFVTGLTASIQTDAGMHLTLSDRGTPTLAERTPAAITTSAVEREQLPELLASRFGLPGFGLDGDGRLIADAQSR